MDQYARYPSLQGRSVLITGGASGIGESLVEGFARQGARVAFLDVQVEAAERLVERVTLQRGAAPRFFPCDLSDVAALQRVAAQIVEQFGGCDVLVNNAGDDTRHDWEDVTEEFWDRTMAVNLRQQFFMAQAILPAMRAAGRGSIVNMSSIAWMIPSTGLPVYVTAKAAIVGMTRTLAHEVGKDGIRVNAVLPGAIATERQRRLWLSPEYEAEVMSRQAIKRLILPDEVTCMVLFLAADDSAGVTSQSLVVDGGWV